MELDFYSVDDNNENQFIGRHIMYIVVDVYSKMIVGVNVGLENNSWNGFKNVLINMVEDKVEFCKRYGIDINKDDWNVQGVLPFRFSTDNGSEYVSNHMEELTKLGIEVNYAQAGMGSFKGTVEQLFNQFNNKVGSRVPGKLHKYNTGMDQRKKARATTLTLMKAAIKFVLYYNKHILVDYPRTNDMFLESISPSPINIWNYAMEKGMHSLKRIVSIENFVMNIMDKAAAKVTNKGIIFEEMIYTVADEKNELWERDILTKASIEKIHIPLPIYYDSRLMDNIFIIIDEKTIRLELNKRKESNAIYFKCSLDAVRLINKSIKAEEKVWDYENLRHEVELSQGLKTHVTNDIDTSYRHIETKNAREAMNIQKKELGIADAINMQKLIDSNISSTEKKGSSTYFPDKQAEVDYFRNKSRER